MPYETIAGNHERASRLGHIHAVTRALADQRSFYVPADSLGDAEDLVPKIMTAAKLPGAGQTRLTGALAIDGSSLTSTVRDGMPSVLYGFVQASAAFVDLEAMEAQRQQRFVDPTAIEKAVETALVTLDLPVAGAYTREGVDIATSWREAVFELFTKKRVEVGGLDSTLLDLLMLLHGTPDRPASGVPVRCPVDWCGRDTLVPGKSVACPQCEMVLYPTDTLRLHEEVKPEGGNGTALGRLMAVLELLVLVGLVTLLWRLSRRELLQQTLFIVDGPLAMYGPPAKLRARALEYFQWMVHEGGTNAPHICGLEKSGVIVDFARELARHNILKPGELMTLDKDVLGRVINADNAIAYGKETYWGRKFIYRARDGRVVVPTVMPSEGAPYDARGGLSHPSSYPTLAAVLDVIDRTGSSMYLDGVIPVAVAHGRAAFPIGVGTDVLKLVAAHKLGLR